ncbi:biliverdin-producing heme oxygenase, partial [Pseudomonas sp. TNT11]|nr:biliverdin-producing heme oxygenase [Pseudomonas emilianonis]
MTVSPSAERPSLRSQRLNQITTAPHTRLDALVKAHAPFETQPNFARFVVAQYLFQSELVALYNDADLIKIVPDLAERCRADAARLDLADLGTDYQAKVD